MFIYHRCYFTASRRSFQKSFLNKVRFVHLFDGPWFLPDGNGERADSDGTTAVFFDDRQEDPFVHIVQTEFVNFECFQGIFRDLFSDNVVGVSKVFIALSEIAAAFEQPIRYTRSPA